MRFTLLLIRVQWIDRRATSSFIIGITLQTALLTLALAHRATGAGPALVLACRAALLTCVTIVLLSAMSSVQNEFRYGTMENVLLGRVPLARLLGLRAASCAVVMSPALCLPFAGAAVAFPSVLGPRTLLLIAMLYLCLAAICYQCTLLLCQFARPSAAVPWFRLALLLVGMSVVPFPRARQVAELLPTGWVIAYAAGTRAVVALPMFLATVSLWTCAVWLAFRKRLRPSIERSLVDGRAAL
ncbi:hypothetical protein [Kitasatospora sp. MAP5-34]|uniref:hypothetical protein n=1 Tax=Kitasatospora sp. MAP5-34 TaxID=3035102 RepID=UPI00247668B2|nr:hypothetical protein [Kitasatospora sp. MAP5-34]MDH6580507.1 hypothetical protein [Kitasatospora sp. MAP5-34]